jgi:cation-transporting ATPase 13A3/4/5
MDGVSLVKVHRLPREQLECNLRLLGVIALENRLKEQTTPVIRQLHHAQVNSVRELVDCPPNRL